MKTFRNIVLALLLLTGCAGFQRDCAAACASTVGSDWIVAQYRFDGTPINCWKLQNTAIENETGTDGIYWQDRGGHLVHISGWYNRVQVEGQRWAEAAATLGVDEAHCKNGVYSAPARDGGQ